MREKEGSNGLAPIAYHQSSPPGKRQVLEHGHGQAHSAPPPVSYYPPVGQMTHHHSLPISAVSPSPVPHPLYSYYTGPPPGYHLPPDSRYPPDAYGPPPHHPHANYHPGYWSQYPGPPQTTGVQHAPGQYPHVPVPAPGERPPIGQYSSQPPPEQYSPGQSYHLPPYHGHSMHHQSLPHAGPPAHLSGHSEYPGMHHPAQSNGPSGQHIPGHSPRFPSPTLRPNNLVVTHSIARLDPDFRQKSPERTMGPTSGRTSIIGHGKYPQTTLPPVSLLPNFVSARQSPIDETGRDGVSPYLDSPPAREETSPVRVWTPDK